MRLMCCLLAGFLLASCKNEDSSGTTDQVAKIEDIIAAQTKAFDNVDPYGIQKGEFVAILKTQELYSSQEPIKNLVEEIGLTITEREEFGTHFDITLIKESVDHTKNDKPHFKFKDVYTIEYPQSVKAAFDQSSRASRPLLMQQLHDQVYELATGASTETQIEYLNLRVLKEKIAPPKQVLTHTPCPEGQDCRLNVTKIFFTVNITSPGEASTRYDMEQWISPDVPYFSAILKNCLTTLIKVDTAMPAIRQCDSVYDYRREALPTP